MDNFKVGDKVVCIANSCMERYVTIGKEYVVLEYTDDGYSYVTVISDNGRKELVFAERFELVKATQEPNGVDAEGQPLHFTTDNLENWMRVVVENGLEYVVAKDDNTFYVRDGAWASDIGDDDWELKEVYAAPQPFQYLDVNAKGKLLWKRTPPKSAEQLAQEAAVAARKAAIEEAEKDLKTAQEKLDMLKGM